VNPKLEVAASAAGLTVEQLVNLVVDSGALALPPSDGITEQFTLEECGERLRSRLSQLPKDGYVEWYTALADVQKGALIISLRNDGASTTSISTNFGIMPNEVQRIYNEFSDKVGQNVTNVRLTTIVGNMQIVAERAQHGAASKDDWSTYWRIQKDLIAQLQSLGIVDKAIHRIEHVHTLGDREKENLERLASLRAKQLARQKEIELVSSEPTTDALPEELQPLDD
jgi:hypothetical protein